MNLYQVIRIRVKQIIAVIRTALTYSIPVPDMSQIIRDLTQMRLDTQRQEILAGKQASQRAFAKKAGLNYAFVQRIENRKQKTMNVDQMSKWLKACGSSLQLYLYQHLNEEERTIAEGDLELTRLFRRALKNKHQRHSVTGVLSGLFPSELPSGKTQKR